MTGFTLLELIVVVFILAAVAAIAIPNLLAARREANESGIKSNLYVIADAEAALKRSGALDANKNGVGEYGGFVELLSTVSWATPGANNCATRAGYTLKLLVASDAETSWRCYAWPTSFGNSGRLAFCINEKRELMQFESDRATFSNESLPVWESVESGTWTPAK